MKTLTKMKKVCCLSRFVLLAMALGMTSIFTSCSSDDDENIPVYSLKDVEGTYSGKMQTTSIAPLENAENEAEDGVTVNAELKDNHILISKFPVEDLIKSIIEDPDAAEAIIKAVGDVEYKIPYQAAFNDNKDNILLQFLTFISITAFFVSLDCHFYGEFRSFFFPFSFSYGLWFHCNFQYQGFR